MCVLIRADSSSIIGTGHIMRDLVLAKQFDEEVIFATQNLKGNINQNILEEGYSVEILLDNTIDELDNLIKRLSVTMIVIDSYNIDFSFEEKLKQRNPLLKIFVLDDTYEKHCCDILLNHSLCAEKSRYIGLVPDGCELRCGAEYILLRDEFYKEKLSIPVEKENSDFCVLVIMGGADHSNINIKVLNVLESIGRLRAIVITTHANSNLKELQSFCEKKMWIDLQINSNKIAQLMKQSDLAIVTPSGTVNEICFIGTPFIAIKTAKNQECMHEYLNMNNEVALEKFNAEKLTFEIKRKMKG